MLYRLAPEHEDAARWKNSLELYREYVALTSRMVPYGLLPNGIYELDNTDFSTITHEGARAAGAPSLEEYNAQVRNGIRLNDRFYLRIFPVAYQFRGFHATLMGRALAAMELARGYAILYPCFVFSLIGTPTSYNPVLPPTPPAPEVRVQLNPSAL